MFNPISIPDYFEEIVTNVATTLGYDLVYKYGTWKVINEELKNNQNNKFPLIGVIRGWRESNPDEMTLQVDDLKIVIAVRSGETDREQKRNDDSYKAQIFPIYKALCEEISNSYFLMGYNQNFKHDIRDWPNIGVENGERMLEDCADGRLLENITLRFNMQTCFQPQLPCFYTPCPNGRMIRNLTIFKDVTITGLNTSLLTLTIADYTYIVAPPTIPAPFVPNIDEGNGSPIGSIDNLVYSINTAALADGYYIGTVTFVGAQFQFFYRVLGGVINQHTSRIQQTVTPTYDCQEFLDTGFHSITVGITYTMVQVPLLDWILTGFALTLFGQSKVNQTFLPITQVTRSSTQQTTYEEGNYAIQQDVSVDSHTVFSNIIFLQTQCIP